MIPVRVNVSTAPPWASRFVIQYTPTVVTLDEEGREQDRTVGFLPPEEFIPALMLGNVKAFIAQGRKPKARFFLQKLLSEYPRSQAAASAAAFKTRV
jgi:thioredoxin-related protein